MPLREAAQAAPQSLDFDNAHVALDAFLKLRGSNATETVYRPYDGDLFSVQDGEVCTPLCGVVGVQKSHWQRAADGAISNRDYDVGIFVDFTTRRPLTLWKNPFTGRTVRAQPYLSGPTGGSYRAGLKSGDVYSDPLDGRWTVIGRQVCHTSVRQARLKNPVSMLDYPLASTGPDFLVSMSTSFSGDIAELADPAVHSAASTMVWTDLMSWEPWMEMGLLRGGTLWRLIGSKVSHRSEIAANLADWIEQTLPGYLTRDAVWDGPNRSGMTEYMRTHQPASH